MLLKRIVTRRIRAKKARFADKKIASDNTSLGLSNGQFRIMIDAEHWFEGHDFWSGVRLPHSRAFMCLVVCDACEQGWPWAPAVSNVF